jgi:hypothetical protein
LHVVPVVEAVATLRRLVLGFVTICTVVLGVVATGSVAPATSVAATKHKSSTSSTTPSAATTCTLLTSTEVQELLNAPPVGPGTPQQGIGTCGWATASGADFDLSISAYPRGTKPPTNPCAATGGKKIHVGAWIGCVYLRPGAGDFMTGFEGSYSVTIEPEVGLTTTQYQSDEKAAITHVLQKLHA